MGNPESDQNLIEFERPPKRTRNVFKATTKEDGYGPSYYYGEYDEVDKRNSDGSIRHESHLVPGSLRKATSEEIVQAEAERHARENEKGNGELKKAA
jgi:hypothetical protein